MIDPTPPANDPNRWRELEDPDDYPTGAAAAYAVLALVVAIVVGLVALLVVIA